MKYGHFDDSNKEYVINHPMTPTPWINYLGNHGFYGLISQIGGGYTFYEDAKLRRITRYRYNQIPTDYSGRFYYLRDEQDIWNPGFLPMKTKLDDYKCRHGMGYSIIESKKNDISTSLKFFIPLDEYLEIHQMVIKNESNVDKKIDLYSYTEWNLWNAVDDQTNFQRNLNIGEVEIDSQTIYHKTEYRERRNHYAFYHVNQDICGYDTDRATFLGLYRGLHEPEVVLNNKSKQSVASGGSPIASHHLHINLKSNEEKTIVFY